MRRSQIIALLFLCLGVLAANTSWAQGWGLRERPLFNRALGETAALRLAKSAWASTNPTQELRKGSLRAIANYDGVTVEKTTPTGTAEWFFSYLGAPSYKFNAK